MMELPLARGRRLVIKLVPNEGGGPPPPSVASSSSREDSAVRRDLVGVHSRKVAIALIVLAVGLFVGSLDYGVREGLPSVALDWLFGLQVLRAALAFVIIAVLGMLIVRGWGGLWPERILTTGVEFPAAEKELERGVAETANISLALLREIKAMERAETRE